MCSGRFRAYGVDLEGSGFPAALGDYRLLFNKVSTDGSGKANIEAEVGCEVWGVLYTIPAADLPVLDQGEVGSRCVALPGRTVENIVLLAWVYVAAGPNEDLALRPYTWYKRFLLEGAHEHSLPEAYIAELGRIPADNDRDLRRDRRKRLLTCGPES